MDLAKPKNVKEKIKKIGALEKTDPLYTPGPGTYQPGINKKTYPKYAFGKACRSIKHENHNPGVGQYTFPSSFPNGPKYSMSSKAAFKPNKTDGTPGPGNYEIRTCTNFTRPKSSTWRIGTAKRPDLNPGDKTTPGVGNYNIGKSLVNQHAWKIGTSTRDDDLKRVKRDNYPGPGNYEYEARNRKSAPKYKFGTANKLQTKRTETPGPGQYHIPCSIVDVNDYTRNTGGFDSHYRYI